MRTLLNLLWNFPGFGFVHAALWAIAGVIAALTIVGLPWAGACFTLASYTLAPFGRNLVRRDELTRRPGWASGPIGVLANVLWFVFLGVWLALAHLATALACAVTIIGLPFAWAHLKLAAASLAPVGQEVVPEEVAGWVQRERLWRAR